MKLCMLKSDVEDIQKNKWLHIQYERMKEAQDQGKLYQYLEENPDYKQVILNLAKKAFFVEDESSQRDISCTN